MLDDIESGLVETADQAEQGTEELKKAVSNQKRARRTLCCLVVVLLAVGTFFFTFFLFSFYFLKCAHVHSPSLSRTLHPVLPRSRTSGCRHIFLYLILFSRCFFFYSLSGSLVILIVTKTI